LAILFVLSFWANKAYADFIGLSMTFEASLHDIPLSMMELALAIAFMLRDPLIKRG